MITSFACDRFYPMIVVQPEAGLSTSAVFQAYHAEAERDDFPEKKPEPDRVRDTPSREQSQNAALSAIRNGHPGADRFAFVNALEGVSRKLCPEIGRLVSELSDCGAEIAMRTGSGSAVFGVFTDEALRRQAMERLSPIHRRIWACETRARSVEIWEDA